MSGAKNTPGRTIGQHAFRGALYSASMRWSIRLLGLFSVVILARLLTPDDFGVVAVSAIVAGMLELFTNLGIVFLVIRESDRSPSFINTAWSMGVVQHLAIALLLVAVAPLAVAWFNEPRAGSAVYMAALVAFIGGFGNIGMVLARKDLDYAKDFRYEVYSKIGSTAATLLFAFMLRSYWALLYGMLAGAVFRVILSYLMHAYRPAFCFQRYRQFLRFGFKAMLLNACKFWNLRIDSMLVGNVYGTTALGLYNTTNEITRMATSEVVTPVARGLLPALATVKNDLTLFRATYLLSFEAVLVLCVGASVGLYAVGDDFVSVVLGEKWLEAANLITWLVWLALSDAILQALLGNVLLVIGKETVEVWVRLTRAAAMTVAIAWAAYGGFGIEAVAGSAIAVTLAFVPVGMLLVRRYLTIPLIRFIKMFVRVSLAGLAMYVAVSALAGLDLQPVIRLAGCILVGAVVYPVATLLLWWIGGRSKASIVHQISQIIWAKFSRA